MAAELTPMMRQYLAIKREVPAGAIVMFRLGDFYEMFGEDAIIAAPILGATLTHRGDQPMCGVPYHALNAYLAKLIRAGKTAALCDQMEDPKLAKGLVRREVTRIVTPGTVTEDGLLDETANNYVAAVSGLGLALLDLSTGEFCVEAFAQADKLAEALERYRPAEMLEANDENRWTFSIDAAFDCLTRHFKVLSLDGFGLTGKNDLICAAGALLYYVGTTLHHSLEHVRKVQLRESDDGLVLDAGTIRHLQLLPGGEVTKDASLLGILDVSKTPMGARTMRNWIARPLARSTEVNARLDAVQTFVDDRSALSNLRGLLSGVRDLERLIAKVDSGRANPRDLKGLASSLRPIPEIKGGLDIRREVQDAGGLLSLVSRLIPQPDLVDLIDRAICDDPPVMLTDGGFIASGYDAELDDLRRIATEGHQWLAEFQTREQQRTGITKLKVKHVSTFGFVIEIPKGSVALAPADYERRQTLTTGERYVTPELKEYERKVMGAQEKAIAIEQRLYKDILAAIAAKTVEVQETSLALGELDAILSLADRALAAGYVRPVVDDSDVLEIVDGRHPIIEQLPDAEPFVPNSAFLNTTTDQIMLITGPNMAGKSTYIRQVATIAVMAQMGSFVPASSMRLGVLDRVFTRIGAGDDLARGRSTFLVEMQETANILNNATPKSLIVLDEIGRGTSTFDGISIAWSVAEYLHGKPQSKAKTLFATHYHELTDLADSFPGVKNFTVKVKEEGGRIVFLRRIVRGIAEKSFGIHVGAMAGLPEEVVTRAGQILKNLEANEIDVNAQKVVRRPRKKLSEMPGQMTFFAICLAGALALGGGTEASAVTRQIALDDGWQFRRGENDWRTVRVPHDWAIAGPFDKEIDKQTVAIVENGEQKAAEKTGRTGSLPWIGKGEYRRQIEIPAGTEYASLLFDGAMSEPEVYCDGAKVGEWKNGYNAFEVTLPAKAGEHEIRVKLTNRPFSSRWYPGAGLIRPVKLVLGGKDGIATWGNAIWTPDLKTVRVRTECRGDVARLVYRVLDGDQEMAVSEKGELKAEFSPWSPENPKLYVLVTEAYGKDGRLVDVTRERFGVRTLAYDRRGFSLNGQPRKFKGVCLHHDLGPLGAAFDKDAFCRQMTLLKEMGCDALRTSHNMPADDQLAVCDELGILVMAESFDAWAAAKVENGYNLFFKDWWRRDLANLVKKCRNHPSVVMWSIGNEISEQSNPAFVSVIREMQALCHSLDPDPCRKVTQGLSWMPQAIESGWNAAMEIPAVTYRLPFYEAMYTNAAVGFVLGAETASTVSSRGEYFFPVEASDSRRYPNLQCSSYDVECAPWSNLPDDDWAMQEDHSWTIGEFVWTGFDYLGEPWPYDEAWPSRSSYFGIFDLAGLPKDRYWLYRSHWNTTSHTLHLVPHWTFPDRVGKVTPVFCYTDFEEAELFVNGVSQGRRRKNRASRLDRFRLRWNDVVYAPGELKVVAYGTDGRPAMTEIVRTAGKPAKVELAKRRFGKLLFVTATIVDAHGTPVPDATDELTFTCGRDLRFRGICNGDATSVESFTVPHMKAYHGQLVAIFEGTGDDVLCCDEAKGI